MVLPFMAEEEGQTGNGGHPSRYDMSKKRTVVIPPAAFTLQKAIMTEYTAFSTTSADVEIIRPSSAARASCFGFLSCPASPANIFPI